MSRVRWSVIQKNHRRRCRRSGRRKSGGSRIVHSLRVSPDAFKKRASREGIHPVGASVIDESVPTTTIIFVETRHGGRGENEGFFFSTLVRGNHDKRKETELQSDMWTYTDERNEQELQLSIYRYSYTWKEMGGEETLSSYSPSFFFSGRGRGAAQPLSQTFA